MLPTLPLSALAGLTFHLVAGSPIGQSTPSAVSGSESSSSSTLVARDDPWDEVGDDVDLDFPWDPTGIYDPNPNTGFMLHMPGWDHLYNIPQSFLPFNQFMTAWRDSSPVSVEAPWSGPPPEYDHDYSYLDKREEVANPDAGPVVAFSPRMLHQMIATIKANPELKPGLMELPMVKQDADLADLFEHLFTFQK